MGLGDSIKKSIEDMADDYVERRAERRPTLTTAISNAILRKLGYDPDAIGAKKKPATPTTPAPRARAAAPTSKTAKRRPPTGPSTTPATPSSTTPKVNEVLEEAKAKPAPKKTEKKQPVKKPSPAKPTPSKKKAPVKPKSAPKKKEEPTKAKKKTQVIPPPPPPPAPPREPSIHDLPPLPPPPKSSAKKVQPWSAKGREDRAKELAKMSPEEKSKEKESSMRRMGFRKQEPGVIDRLKTAWKAFKAKPGETVKSAEPTYRSIFNEIADFLEEQNLIGQLTLSEMMDIMGEDAKIVLSENHTTNEWVTLLSESGLFLEETVEEAYTLEEWIGMMEETGVNLNEADRKTLDSYVEKAIPSLKDLIKNHGHFDKKTLKRSKGIRRALHLIHKKDKEEMQNSAYQPSESYTLEEWMGALEEAGYNINEFLGSRYDITPNSAYERDRNAGYPTSDKVRVVGGRIVPRPPKSKKVEKSKPRNEQGNNANLGITPNGNTTSRIEKIAAHIGGLIGNPDQSKFVGYRDDNTEREKFAGRHNLPTHARREKMAQRSEQDDKLVSQKVSTIPRSISPADSSRMVANTPPGTERDAMTQRIGIQNYANQIAATKKAQGRQGGLTIRPTNPIPETVSLNENTVTRLQELAGITPVK